MNKVYLLFLPLFFITPIFAEEITWLTISVSGEYRNWDTSKEPDIFNLQYAITNATITNIETIPTLTIFEIDTSNNGTIYLNIPKNYPFTNYPSEGRERDALYVKIDEKRINTDNVDIQYDDCYYKYSVPFSKNNSKIEFGFSKTLGSNPYIVEDVPLSCLSEVFNNKTSIVTDSHLTLKHQLMSGPEDGNYYSDEPEEPLQQYQDANERESYRDAVELNAETYCPTTHILIEGKCQPANYVDPLYWVVLIALVPVSLITIFVLKSKTKNIKN